MNVVEQAYQLGPFGRGELFRVGVHVAERPRARRNRTAIATPAAPEMIGVTEGGADRGNGP
ncbi:MAG: hypothetical protein HOW59_12130, partial [Nonomuraea sp.]|nr:hypothetical protein [Nonomuraea sp.]